MALARGRLGTEKDRADPHAVGGPRGAAENIMLGLASRCVRASIIRLPPVVHGDGDHGFLAPFIGTDNPASSALTRARLGWEPTHQPLLDDLQHGTYFTR